MNRWVRRSLAVISLSAIVAGAVAGALFAGHSAGVVRTEDRNGDGRPDVWRTYDRQGRIAEADVDSNFDGRSDVREYYQDDALVRRESDRDFNDRIDRIDEFDPATHDRTRSVLDVDDDGTADLLVLFQGGHAVFSKWARPAATALAVPLAPGAAVPRRAADDRLAPLEDPFRTDLAVKAVRAEAGAGASVALSISGGLPAQSFDAAGPITVSPAVFVSRSSRPFSALVAPFSPRGPPASRQA